MQPADDARDAERPRASSERLLTAGRLAARWQVATSHVYRLTRDGAIPVVRLGRYHGYRLDAIERWEARSEHSAGSPPERRDPGSTGRP
jgi:predicted DNA-binding transcriptional regulator AlpA